LPVTDDLLDLLDARSGIVCTVGAGGKKSLLQYLATHHPGRVAITATVFTTYFQEKLGFTVVIDEEARLPGAVARITDGSSVAYACPADTPQRRAGVTGATIERIHVEGRFAASYVKADGARMRWIKAPAADEPVVPAACTTVIPILSVLAVGERLSPRTAHRLDRIKQVTGLAENEMISAGHIGQLLASPQGLMKCTESYRVVPVLNMVDDAGREVQARKAAEVALDLNPRIDRVVLVCLARGDDPVVGVVTR
jgi:probable selenium-dependent hydroxylase accessory protein YqeC